MIEINHIYNEDCIQGMKKIGGGKIDLIICDLPYGTTRNKWDSVIPIDELWSEYNRIIKDNGAIVLFSQMPFSALLVMSNIDMFKYEWIWKKEQGTGHLNANFAPLKIHENILVFSKSAACFVKDSTSAMVFNPQYRSGKAYHSKCNNPCMSSNYDVKSSHSFETIQDGKHYRPNDIIEFNRDTDSFHPTQKPVNLLRYLVRTYSNEGDLILDNCMGSGSTAIACIKEKRNFIGFELNKEYYDKANERIKNEQRQLSLF